MTLEVREMKLEEVDIVIDYFLSASAEHLEMLGVDPHKTVPGPLNFHQAVTRWVCGDSSVDETAVSAAASAERLFCHGQNGDLNA